MTPEFARAVDPVFIYVIDLLDRIERNEALVAEDEQVRVRGHIDRAEATLGGTQQWQLAKYGLVVWIDEILIDAPWDGSAWWTGNTLEFQLFNTAEAFRDFYAKADEASRLTHKDALEVFYVCVVLGFRGLYRDDTGAGMAEQMGLPPDLLSWAQRTALAIELRLGRPKISNAKDPDSGAPPLDGKIRLVNMSLICVTLLAVTLVVAAFTFDLLSSGR